MTMQTLELVLGTFGLGFIGSLILTKIDFALESYVNLD